MRVDVYLRAIYESMMEYVQSAGSAVAQRCLYFPDQKLIIGYRPADLIFGHNEARIDFISDNLELLDGAQLLSSHQMLDDIVLDVVSKEKQYRESEKEFLEKAKGLRYWVENTVADFHQEEGEK